MAKPKETTQETGAKAPEPVVERKADKEYFEIIGSKNKRILTQKFGLINLRFGVPNNALEIYKSGKKFLGLKKGAEVLFENETKEVIEKLITQAPRKEDVVILKKLLK